MVLAFQPLLSAPQSVTEHHGRARMLRDAAPFELAPARGDGASELLEEARTICEPLAARPALERIAALA